MSTVREVLDQIDEVLVKGGPDGRDLWSVLTALRGPDNENYSAKRDQTVPIRRAAFPKTAADSDASGDQYHNGADFGYSSSRYLNSDRYGHFDQHAFDAAHVLRLR